MGVCVRQLHTRWWGQLSSLAVGALIWTCRRSVRVDEVLAAYAKQPNCTTVKIVYPQDGTLFPPEIVAPTVRWEDENAAASLWLVRVEVADGQAPIDCLSRERQWTPTAQDWERIKKGSREKEARVLVLGVRSGLRGEGCIRGRRHRADLGG